MLPYEIAFDKNGNSTFSYFRERIVKNNGKFKFVEPIHEVIVPSGNIEYKNIIAIKTVGNFINRSLVHGFVMNAENTVIFLRKPQKITKTFVGSPKRLVTERDNTGVYTEIFKNIPKKFQFFIVIQKTAP